MKGLGLAGAGLGAGFGAAKAITPVFHDLDEISASSKAFHRHGWWVKEVDEPTVKIDWSVLNFKTDPYRQYGTLPEAQPKKPGIVARRNARWQASILQNIKGGRLKDLAVCDAPRFYGEIRNLIQNHESTVTDYLGISGAPRHEGTPEDNLRMIQAASHYFGSPTVGVVAVDDRTLKLHTDGVRFENVDEWYEDGKTVVVPSKCKWIISYLVPQQQMMNRMGVDVQKSGPLEGYQPFIGKSGVYSGYLEAALIGLQLQRFLKMLGYQAFWGRQLDYLPIPFGVMTGVAEQGRPGFVISPRFGNSVRETPAMLTDLPLQETKPIDAGLKKFCITCKICADTCPSSSISFASEPSHDIHYVGGVPINRMGIEAWKSNWQTCVDYGAPRDCNQCQGSCPFSHLGDALIHPIVRAVVGTTSVFNGFFAQMERFVDYKKSMDPDVWWNRNLATYPYDNIANVGSGFGPVW